MPSPPHRPPSKRVLVVEDDMNVRTTIEMGLRAGGHEVVVAESGEAALKMFKEAGPDLVLTEFILGGMDGLELAAAIRQRVPQQRIILLTAFAEKARAMDGVSNVDAVVGKPFSLMELYRAVAEVFREPKAGEN